MPEFEVEYFDRESRRLVDAAGDIWIRRLVDYSRANALLFYRDLKVGTLDLGQQPKAVKRLLAGDALSIDALMPPLSDDIERDPVQRERMQTDMRIQTHHTLVTIQRKALSNLEEKGIDTLFLALGMATWPTEDGGRPYEAPVLLVPAHIGSRGRGSDNLRLAVNGEPMLNPVLLFVLEEEFALHLPADAMLKASTTEDEIGRWTIDTESAFAEVECAAQSVHGFRVQHRAVLGNFHFSRMAMVEDLRRNRDAMVANPIVAAIAGHSESRQRFTRTATNIEPATLDERPASDDYLVLDADSTQHRAIVAACKGQSGIIQGPPGTGKSQTIANLIAQSIAEGRRVLFVAEKRAALDAVIKRLNHSSIGLGHVILDLHGASISRKEVMAQLGSTLEHIKRSQPVNGADGIHRELEARRRQLNEHARRMNTPRQPAELSANQIIGRLLRLSASAASTLRLRGQVLAELTPERVSEVLEWIGDGKKQPTLLLGTDSSPWNDAEIRDGDTASLVLDQVTLLADELWPRFETLLGSVVQSTAIRPPETLKAVAALLLLLSDVRHILGLYGPEIFESHPDELAKRLAAAERGILGRFWAYVTHRDYRAARNWLRTLRTEPAATPKLLEEARLAADILYRWRELGVTHQMPHDVEASTELEDAYITLQELLTSIEQVAHTGSFDSMQIEHVGEVVRALANDTRTPFILPHIHELREKFASAGLQRLLKELLDHNVPPEHWAARFEYVWLYSTLESVFANEPGLASFSGRAHEQLIGEFIRLDRERLQLAAERVRRLHAERAIIAMNEHYAQNDLVRKEVSKRSRHIPLRELFARAPDVVTRIAPCWIASPLSVSQLMDGGQRHFDLVIFDEASQVLLENAIPSLYRADQVVVAGDQHQLPPTTFFATAVEGEDDILTDDEEVQDAKKMAIASISGFESLLDTLNPFLSNWMLEWHYRSEDERLIAFSNEHIYDRRLITFPSARAHQAIRHVLVPHDASLGTQQESASREVEEVVRQIIVHAETRPRESLGVIAMGIRHANRVQAVLDRAVDLRPDLADFFSLDREERFFVKNLETVQGDERDAIILTIGYGKTATGDLPHRFGPLTQETGHRRLNVAVTRARRRMTVVSSFSHHEIDLDRSGSRGVKLLKLYLEYAAKGGTRLPENEIAGEVGLNAFEADIRDALEAKGIHTRSQFGVSRYRIDLVAMHPDKPGQPILAIECDGASYHSSATARDRDRLRQSHLQRLGWRFHRIWSTDWFYNREEEIERAFVAYQDAVVRHADLSDEDQIEMADPVHHEPGPALIPQRTNPQRSQRPRVTMRSNISEYSDWELGQIAEWIVSDGLLRTDDEIVREMLEILPFQRMGARIRERLFAVAQRVRPDGDC